MPVYIDPEKVRPMAGKILVHLEEQLGGYTPGGLFMPPNPDDTKKDTAIGRVMRLGPMPATRHTKPGEKPPIDTRDSVSLWTRPNRSGAHWPAEFQNLKVDDVICFPRDVHVVIVWNEQRYALVEMEELLFVFEGDYHGEEVVLPRPA